MLDTLILNPGPNQNKYLSKDHTGSMDSVNEAFLLNERQSLYNPGKYI